MVPDGNKDGSLLIRHRSTASTLMSSTNFLLASFQVCQQIDWPWIDSLEKNIEQCTDLIIGFHIVDCEFAAITLHVNFDMFL